MVAAGVPDAPTAQDTAPEASGKPSGPSVAPALPPGITAIRRDVVALALSGDGQHLVGGDLAGNALLWDLGRGRFLWADPTPEGNRLGRVAFAAAAPIYLAGAFDAPDRPWRAWCAEPMERRGELGTAGWTGVDAALDATGTRALTLSSAPDGKEQRLELWQLGAPSLIRIAVPVARAARGSVALDEAAERAAVSDDVGGVKVYAVGEAAAAKAKQDGEAKPLLAVSADGGDAEAVRVARVALTADGEVLAGAIGGGVVLWSVSGATAARTQLIGDGQAPVRGLHRVGRGAESRIVAVTRPPEGGLALWELDGRPAGVLETRCRCETHALSGDGKVAVCGCAEAAELRWGRVR